MEAMSSYAEVKYEIGSFDISNLEGRVLTQIDAISADETQRKALKDIFRSLIWDWAFQRMPAKEGMTAGVSSTKSRK